MNVKCPYCDQIVEVEGWFERHNLERLGDALCECTLCGRKYRAFYDADKLVATRIGPRVVKGGIYK